MARHPLAQWKPKGVTARARAKKRAAKEARYRKACEEVDKRVGPWCEHCRRYLEIAHHHHILPRSLGGDDVPENLQRLCAICHARPHRIRIGKEII